MKYLTISTLRFSSFNLISDDIDSSILFVRRNLWQYRRLDSLLRSIKSLTISTFRISLFPLFLLSLLGIRFSTFASRLSSHRRFSRYDELFLLIFHLSRHSFSRLLLIDDSFGYIDSFPLNFIFFAFALPHRLFPLSSSLLLLLRSTTSTLPPQLISPPPPLSLSLSLISFQLFALRLAGKRASIWISIRITQIASFSPYCLKSGREGEDWEWRCLI